MYYSTAWLARIQMKAELHLWTDPQVCVREERLLVGSRLMNMSVTTMCMTPIIIILSRWSDLTPTSHVWTGSQDRVPSVWCCPAPYWLSNEGPQKEGVVLGRVPRSWAWHHLHPAPAVDSQPASPPQQTQATQGPRREERPLGLQEISMARSIDCSAVAKETGAGSLRPQCEDFLSSFTGLTCSVKEPPLHTQYSPLKSHTSICLSKHKEETEATKVFSLVLYTMMIPFCPTSFFLKISIEFVLHYVQEKGGKDSSATEAL